MIEYFSGVIACFALAFGYSWYGIRYGALRRHNWPMILWPCLFSWVGIGVFVLLAIWARRWKRK